MAALTWVLVSCTTLKEARRIGSAVLAARQAACFDIFPRALTRYFWPPRRGKIQTARGALLVLETTKPHLPTIRSLVRQHHSDRLPFIGALRIEEVEPAYEKWLNHELRPGS